MNPDDPLGSQIMDLAMDMAACSSERATTRDWEEHPMFGIEVDKDKWAVAYQDTAKKLKEVLTTNSIIIRDAEKLE
jgi:hypothetical protein